MKISSKFKDYYDYVAHQFGGGDPKVLYLRNPIPSEDCSVQLKSKNRIFQLSNYYKEKISYKYLAIAGKLYVLRAESLDDGTLSFTEHKLFTRENFPEFYDKTEKKANRWWWSFRNVTEEDVIGVESPELTEIAKKIRQPVFMINLITADRQGYTFHIDTNIPILQDYKIPHIISAEQMYQNIAYYMTNKMQDSPDLSVPAISSDKEKALQHGFDTKQSFRHRK